MARLVDLNLILLWKGFIQGQKVKSALSSIIGDVKFEDLQIPLAVVAADVESMEQVVIKTGSVLIILGLFQRGRRISKMDKFKIKSHTGANASLSFKHH